ncbi:glycosyltransferase family A protein [Paenibacillus sp. LHD-38]|uniref:glycosyltransferase family A protein n=1 Tax=Paenibacillus sp. LHD-38 TaxID=3072143 RepID=UPI00280C9A9C|nr:glycosyltransferase family A protein [Paenibacillus sp. LHD-38]MDQ8735769.1 glycosyltransferase family A protein [Paenibacillus sp. LHD-38]
MPNKKIIIGIEFNNRSKPNNRWKVGLTRQWIEYRMSIFMKYTLQSLKNQTNQNFTVLVRYAISSESTILQTLSKYEALPGNVRFVPDGQYLKVQKELTRGYKYLYLVRLDCDDMYHKTFIKQLHNYKPKQKTRALINQTGYVYDSLRHRVATVKKPSPPFYTFIYRTSAYFKGLRYKTPKGHTSVIKLKHEILTKNGKRNYMVVVHERNTLNQRLLSKTNFVAKQWKVNKIMKNYVK